MPVQTTIALRRDTANNWVSVNPVLELGEPGYDITNNKIKLGDGTNTWANLSYMNPGNVTSITYGNSNVTVAPNGNVTFGATGTANVFTITGGVAATTGNASGNLIGNMVYLGNAGASPIEFMANGNATFNHNVRIEGNLNTVGTLTGTTALSNLSVSNAFIYMAANNTITDMFDQGVVGNYSAGAGNLIGGVFRDASDFGAWKVFEDNPTYPSANSIINTNGLVYANFMSKNVNGQNIIGSGNTSANVITANTYLTGDGSNLTNLAWSNRAVGGTSNVTIAANANITMGVQGNANIVTVTGTGVTLKGLTSTTKSDLGPVANVVITGGTTGQAVKTNGNGVISFAPVSADRIQNGSSNINSVSNGAFTFAVAGANGVGNVDAYGVNLTNDLVVTGNLPTVNVLAATNTITSTFVANSNAQPNIKSLGTLTGLSFDGDPTGNLVNNFIQTGSATFSNGSVTLDGIANVKIQGGSLSQYIQTDGTGNLVFWENALFVGAPWAITNAYGAGQVIKYRGALYIANGAVPANTPFAVGSAGATWSQIGGVSSGTATTLGDFAANGTIPVAAVDYNNIININQSTGSIYITVPAPTSSYPRILQLVNIGTAPCYINTDFVLSNGYSVVMVWTGTAWQFAAVNPSTQSWSFTEPATGLSFTGKSGTIYDASTILTVTANTQVPLNTDGVMAAALSGTGNMQVFGGGNANFTGNSTYTGSTLVKVLTTYQLLDNGLLGAAASNISPATGGTKTVNGTTVTHVFTESGVLTLPDSPIPTTFSVQYLVVGGGGGGGAGTAYVAGGAIGASGRGGGGGAGGQVKTGTQVVSDNQRLIITVGDGGIRGYYGSENGSQGGSSSIQSSVSEFTTITALGGLGGGGGGTSSTQNLGGVGSSGGGNGGTTASSANATDATTGSNGTTSTISGSSQVYASGGGAGGSYLQQTGTSGGTGGGTGGYGGPVGSGTSVPNNGTVGSNGTGYGAGGGGGAGLSYGVAGTDGGRGGKGVVIVRYTVNGGGPSATGGTVTTSGNLTIHTFTTNDVFQVPSAATFSNVRYLVVGAGGAGAGTAVGNTNYGFGGGEGGQVLDGYITVTPSQVININIGSGGNAQSANLVGGTTTISGIGMTAITAAGGNGGANIAGGTGGAGADGGGSSTASGVAGTTGTVSTITGGSVVYGGGGGGGRGALGSSAGAGGSGGGGAGGSLNTAGSAGVTGGGGGGAGSSRLTPGTYYGGNGGPGLVILSYSTPYAAYDATYANTLTVNGTFIHNSYNNEIFTGAVSGTGTLRKQRLTTDTFSGGLQIDSGVFIDEGILQVGNGSAGAGIGGGALINNMVVASNATVQFLRDSINVATWINGSGNIQVLGTGSANGGNYNLASANLDTFTGTLLIGANAAVTGGNNVVGKNIAVANTGAFIATAGNVAGNISIVGNGWSIGSSNGAMRLTGANVTGNVTLTGDAMITTTGNATIGGNITGNYGVYYTAPNANVNFNITGNALYKDFTNLTTGRIVANTANAISNISAVTLASGTELYYVANMSIGSLNGAGNVNTSSNSQVITTGLNNRTALFTGKVLIGGIIKVGTGNQLIASNSFLSTDTASNSFTLTGNTSITNGTLVVGDADSISQLPSGNVTVTAPGNITFNRADSTSSGNGVVIHHSITGDGNITFKGNSAGTYGTGYLPTGPFPAYANGYGWIMPNNQSFTGNILISNGARWKLFTKDNAVLYDISSGGQLWLDSPWQPVAYGAGNYSITLPPGNTYTVEALIVAGGGGGGGGTCNYANSALHRYASGAGGGGGGCQLYQSSNQAAGTYPIVVGAGGAGGTGYGGYAEQWGNSGQTGGSSSVFGITSFGGEGGSGVINNSPAAGGFPNGGTSGSGNWLTWEASQGRYGFLLAGQSYATASGTSFSAYGLDSNTVFSPGGNGGRTDQEGQVPGNGGTPAMPLPAGAAQGGSAQPLSPTQGTFIGAGGGGGSSWEISYQIAPEKFTNGSAGRDGLVMVRYTPSGDKVLASNVTIRGNGINENGTYRGAIRCDLNSWNITGNISIPTDARLFTANSKTLTLSGNISGSGNLEISGNSQVNLNSANNAMTGNIIINTGFAVGNNTTEVVGYRVNANAYITASSNSLPTTYTTTGNINIQANGRMRVYSNGTSQLGRITCNNFTVGAPWYIDMMTSTGTSGTYTLIASTQPLPVTVPSLGTNNTGKLVVFSYVNGTGLVVTLS